MSDVRTLLRGERAARRVEHAQAVYTASGKLECRICRSVVKSDEQAWKAHLTSTQHAMRVEKARLSTRPGTAKESPTPKGPVVKKRKVSLDEPNGRKKTRPAVSFADEDLGSPQDPAPDVRLVEEANGEERRTPSPQQEEPDAQIDEAEWSAFERDIAMAAPASPPATETIMANASISAAPVSAAEMVARKSEESRAEIQQRKEAEAEAEQEDAKRALEDEFDEMEALEVRVQRLKERRDALRQTATVLQEVQPIPAQTVDDNDESDVDDLDAWTFGR